MFPFRTLAKCVQGKGQGLHTNQCVTFRIVPKVSSCGITFVVGEKQERIEALPTNLLTSPLCTTLSNGKEKIQTVEHFLSACYALNIWSLELHCDQNELPAFDGSSQVWIDLLKSGGQHNLKKQMTPFSLHQKIQKTFPDGSFFEIEPNETGLLIDYTIDFSRLSSSLGRQQLLYEHSESNYLKEIVFARTFCLKEQIQTLREKKLILGGSLDNAVVYDRFHVLNPEGLRDPHEAVRHKILDFLGDLSLFGRPVQGTFRIFCGGHKVHHEIVKILKQQEKEESKPLFPKQMLSVSTQKW